MPGTVKSQGLEIISKWVVNDFLNLGLNYTYNSTYDGAEQDDPIKFLLQCTNGQVQEI